jgi:hypothetical protein
VHVSFVREAYDWEVDVSASFFSFFFLICCTQLEQDGKVKTSFGEFLLKKGCSYSIRFLFVMLAFLFLGRVLTDHGSI